MKRAQITYFFAIGLTVLILLVLIMTLVVLPRWQSGLSKEDVVSVSSLVESCTGFVLEEQLRQIGASGGYLQTSTFQHHPYPWESEVVTLPAQEVVYWSHMLSCAANDYGCEYSLQPALCSRSPCLGPISAQHSIQEQMEDAFAQQLLACIDDFSQIEEFEITVLDNPQTEITIEQYGVLAQINYPLRISNGEGDVIRLDEFTNGVDVNLAGMYALAYNITQAQRQYGIIEDRTMHLISIYGGVGRELPPMRELKVLGGRQFWSRTQVEEIIQYDVLPWLNFLQLANTIETYRPIFVAEEELRYEEMNLYAGIFEYLTFKTGEDIEEDLGVQFFYPNSRPYLSINGGQELLKSRGVGGGFISAITGVFINDFRFKYDLSFPMVVSVRDPEAFNGDGYEFSFALEANIRNNGAIPRNTSRTSMLLNPGVIDFSAQEHRVDAPYVIRAVDTTTNAPLANVRISYQCGEESYLGETNANGRLETTLPFCRYGGALLYSRAGYLGSGIELDNYETATQQTIDITLQPLTTIQVNLLKRERSAVTLGDSEQQDIGTLFTYEEKRIADYELAMVNFNRLGSNYDEENPIPPFFVISNNDTTFSSDGLSEYAIENLTADDILSEGYARRLIAEKVNISKVTSVELKIAPGNYSIDAFIMNNKPFELAEQKVGGIFGKRVAGANFSSWLTGNTKINFTITREDLEKGQNLTLYIVTEQPPKDWKEMMDYQGLNPRSDEQVIPTWQ